MFDHRASSPSNDYTYDGLNRLEDVEYLDNVNDTESFAMDDLGNRDGSQTLRSGTVSYTVDDDTNRYTAIGTGNPSPTHDNAGNLTTDHRGYDYIYDYENRLVAIKDSSGLVAGFGYDALGRRLGKWLGYDTIYYYYNANWQVLYEDSAFNADRQYVYGNYIDETLMMDDGTDDHYYAHNHLFSTVALIDGDGDVVERYEYDAYGKATMLDPDFTAFSGIAAGNPYTFTGRRLDSLDGGDLSIMYYRFRYYDPETGRFLTHDPLGIVPNGGEFNKFESISQYSDGTNIYQYTISCPTMYRDPYGEITAVGGAIAGCIGNSAWGFIKGCLTGKERCNLVCEAVGNCLIGGLAGAVAGQFPQYAGCLMGAAAGIGGEAVGYICNSICGNGNGANRKTKAKCAAVKAIVSLTVGCISGQAGKLTSEIEAFAMGIAFGGIGEGFKDMCEL